MFNKKIFLVSIIGICVAFLSFKVNTKKVIGQWQIVSFEKPFTDSILIHLSENDPMRKKIEEAKSDYIEWARNSSIQIHKNGTFISFICSMDGQVRIDSLHWEIKDKNNLILVPFTDRNKTFSGQSKDSIVIEKGPKDMLRFKVTNEHEFDEFYINFRPYTIADLIRTEEFIKKKENYYLDIINKKKAENVEFMRQMLENGNNN